MVNLSQLKLVTANLKTVDLAKFYNQANSKIKGTFVEKLVNYIRNVCTDYKDVAISVRQDIKDKPVKAACVFTGMGFLAFSMTHNPNEQSFRAKFVDCANNVALVSPNMVNPRAVQHITYIQQCYNKNLIRHTSLGLFSIIWADKYSNECDTYETNCSYLKLPYLGFTSHILDVGFLNIWWVISRNMLDYDINY